MPALRTTRHGATSPARLAAYELYRVLPEPSVKKVAEIMGLSPRTVERWCQDDDWVARRETDSRPDVATMRDMVPRLLGPHFERLTDRLLALAYQDARPDVALRATTHALALFGVSPIQKSATVVQHIRSSSAGSVDVRDTSDIVAAFHARVSDLLALDAGRDTGAPPGTPTPGLYGNEREDEDERGPSLDSATRSEQSFTSGIIEAEFVERDMRAGGGEGADGVSESGGEGA